MARRKKTQREIIRDLRRENKALREDFKNVFSQLVLHRALEKARAEALEGARQHEELEAWARQPITEQILDQQVGWWWRRVWVWVVQKWTLWTAPRSAQ